MYRFLTSLSRALYPDSFRSGSSGGGSSGGGSSGGGSSGGGSSGGGSSGGGSSSGGSSAVGSGSGSSVRGARRGSRPGGRGQCNQNVTPSVCHPDEQADAVIKVDPNYKG